MECFSRTFDSGVDLIRWLQGFSPDLDRPFRLLSFLGNEGFYLFLLPFLYWCVDRHAGARLTLLFLASAYVNAAAKVLAAQPRPFQYDTRIRQLMEAGGGGLPSGHAQNGLVVWGYLASVLRRPWAWVAAPLLILAISLSRLYLGVHFPVDIAGGYLLGGALLAVVAWLGPGTESWLVRQRSAVQVALALAVPGILILLSPSWDRSCITAGAAWMGTGVGLALERRRVRFEVGGSWGKRTLRFFVGFAVSIVFWAGLKYVLADLEPDGVFRFLRYGLLGFWASFGAPWVFVRLGMARGRRVR